MGIVDNPRQQSHGFVEELTEVSQSAVVIGSYRWTSPVGCTIAMHNCIGAAATTSTSGTTSSSGELLQY
jgi:hypothetical protein